MKKSNCLLVIGLLLFACLTSSSMAVWTDNFESYPISWTAIPSPWLTGDAPQPLYVQGTIGYGTPYSRGAGGPGGWNNAHQWRATDGEAVTQVFAKVFNSSGETYSEAWIHLSGAASISVDDVNLRLFDDGTGGATSSSIMLVANDYDNGSYVTDNRATVQGLSLDTWYDIRMNINGSNVTGEYKEVTASTWNTVGTVSTYSDFGDTYIGSRLGRSGYLDDIGYVPEPATMALLGFGGLLLRRRKA